MAIYTDILQELRRDKKITQEMMARRFGISRVMYGYYETGRRTMPPEMLSILADELDTSTDYILGRTAVQTPYPPRSPRERPPARILQTVGSKSDMGA